MLRKGRSDFGIQFFLFFLFFLLCYFVWPSVVWLSKICPFFKLY